MTKTRFIVAIGDVISSALVRAWVTERPWLQLAGVCTTADALSECAYRNTEAVLVTDARLGGKCIISTLSSLHLARPSIRIVTVLEEPEGPQAAEVIRAGAMGIVAARDMVGFQEAIVKVLRGDLAMRGNLALRLMRAAYANKTFIRQREWDQYRQSAEWHQQGGATAGVVHGRTLVTVTKHEVIQEMWAHGGSFMHCLAVAWCAADDYNRDLIETVWGREFYHHAVMAQKRKEAKNGTNC